MPLSHIASSTRPLVFDASSSFFATGPSSTFQACGSDWNRKGRPSTAYSGTTPEVVPCELALKASVPRRMLVSASTSSPYWALPPTSTFTRPSVFWATSSANFSEASAFGLPGAALWARRRTCWAQAAGDATRAVPTISDKSSFFIGFLSLWTFVG